MYRSKCLRIIVILNSFLSSAKFFSIILKTNLLRETSFRLASIFSIKSFGRDIVTGILILILFTNFTGEDNNKDSCLEEPYFIIVCKNPIELNTSFIILYRNHILKPFIETYT